jgi:TolB-like protein
MESKTKRWLSELRRRKVIRAAIAYLVVAWLLLQVADVTFGPMGLPEWTISLVMALLVLGFPLTCVLAWVFDLAPSTDPHASEAPAAATAGGSTIAPAPEPAVAEIPAESVAILPFVDMSAAHDQEYFCDGMAEEIINALCVVRGLRVASRTSSFQYKGHNVDIREIGRQLGVRSVLEGSVRRANDQVRITVQLLNAADGYHIWSQSYDRKLEDVFAIQTEIAQRMVDALKVSLSPRETQLLGRGGTSNGMAYDFFLKGQQLLHAYSGTVDAAAMFRLALGEDANFAQAHAGLANALAVKGMSVDITSGEYDEAFAASRRALELEPWMPEAFVARACLRSMQGEVELANRDFEDAIRLNPTAFYTYYLFGRHHLALGQSRLAAKHFRTAARLAPEEYTPLGMLAMALRKIGETEEALEVSAQMIRALERHLQNHPDDEAALGRGAVVSAWMNEPIRAAQFVEQSLVARPESFIAAYNGACAFAILNDKDKALQLLDRAVSNGRGNLTWFEHDDDLANLRGDPAFEAIVNRLRSTAVSADN